MVVTRFLEWVLFGLISYTFLIALAGFLPRRRISRGRRAHQLLVLIPAHDEAAVVGEAVRALAVQDYPRDRFRVVVVADNCGDATAERARAAGADLVLERTDRRRLGKGFALAWASERALAFFPAEAVCVFDADNVMGPGFLSAMDDRLSAGDLVVQGAVETKNPGDSWVTRASTLGQAVAARLFQRSRDRLGMSVSLAGTGYCIRTEVLRAHPADPSCLTDDHELQLRLLRAGIRVAFAPEAITFDEKPITLGASLRQRVRWAQGHWDVARRHTLPLLARALRRADPAALDGAVSCLQPSRSVNAMLAAGLIALRGGAWLAGLDLGGWLAVPVAAWAGLLACHLAFPLAALLADGVPPRVAVRYASTALLQATWLPVLAVGLLRSRDRRWIPTRHTRSISAEARLAGGEDAPRVGAGRSA